MRPATKKPGRGRRPGLANVLLGAWAAAGASQMPAIAEAVSTYCECVTVIGDSNDAGRKNAGELKARLRARGLEVIFRSLVAALLKPPDVNQILREHGP